MQASRLVQIGPRTLVSMNTAPVQGSTVFTADVLVHLERWARWPRTGFLSRCAQASREVWHMRLDGGEPLPVFIRSTLAA
jgi:hypothetical protein